MCYSDFPFESLGRVLYMAMPPSLLQADLSRGGAQNAVALQPIVAKRLRGAVSTVTLKTMSLLDGRMVTAPAALITRYHYCWSRCC
jgi:hypothetical protein